MCRDSKRLRLVQFRELSSLPQVLINHDDANQRTTFSAASSIRTWVEPSDF